MVDPTPSTLRRRSEELFASAEREQAHDADSAALLLFYAVECRLKSVYMIDKKLKNTADVRGNAQSAKSYNHNIGRLIRDLNIPRASVAQPPKIVFDRTGNHGEVPTLHEAWRYGEKIRNMASVYTWLKSLIEWCRKNR